MLSNGDVQASGAGRCSSAAKGRPAHQREKMCFSSWRIAVGAGLRCGRGRRERDFTVKRPTKACYRRLLCRMRQLRLATRSPRVMRRRLVVRLSPVCVYARMRAASGPAGHPRGVLCASGVRPGLLRAVVVGVSSVVMVHSIRSSVRGIIPRAMPGQLVEIMITAGLILALVTVVVIFIALPRTELSTLDYLQSLCACDHGYSKGCPEGTHRPSSNTHRSMWHLRA